MPEQQVKLSGSVADALTGEPLIGANVIIVGTDFGSATDVNGNFFILNIPPGNYSVKISYIGYESKVVTNVGIIVDQTTCYQSN